MTDFRPAREIKKKTLKYVLDNFDNRKLESFYQNEHVKLLTNSFLDIYESALTYVYENRHDLIDQSLKLTENKESTILIKRTVDGRFKSFLAS